jgi:hypothetical protein
MPSEWGDSPEENDSGESAYIGSPGDDEEI